ncbi:MAG: hypothetical protein KIT86_21100 [Hydrogenophaga sp.]|uniref:hypothetical protein n=1 Tax=Hydrogenophaga sp. TaxID=1904254 RepID=UPI00262B6D83|nr:hypothetical protein [Hydrogenophaga sp.]MCW5672164.1 hypothetical protein [Hydrogenophaga sp.]
MTAVTLRVHEVQLFERHVTLRLPFRFGAATVTQCPQAFARVLAEVDGRRVEGASAELMVPKWFDKSPALTHEQNFEQLRESLRNAREAMLAIREALSPYAFSQEAGEAAIATSVGRRLPRLAAQFGPALLDKAVADAALRAAGRSWVDGVHAGVLGDPWGARLELDHPTHVVLRHTVGLADRLIQSDEGADPQDGLPATLEAAIQRHGLHHFKLKLSGQLGADVDRLTRIAEVLQRQVGEYRVTLDGNETFTDATSLGRFWQALRTTPALADLLRRTLLLEQPLARAVALRESIASLGIGVPVILDESDDHAGALDEGLALGYHGISSKACKGIYRSLRNAHRIAQDPRLLLSGEDLTCQAGLAVQQDTLLAASLGVRHIERNGHHYVDGFGTAPADEAQAFARAHPGFYETTAERPHLAVRQGQLDLRALHVPGFATAAMPQWRSLQAIA